MYRGGSQEVGGLQPVWPLIMESSRVGSSRVVSSQVEDKQEQQQAIFQEGGAWREKRARIGFLMSCTSLGPGAPGAVHGQGGCRGRVGTAG